MKKQTLRIGMAQMSPIWLNKLQTIEKIKVFIEKGGKQNCDLLVFGEGLLPGYPFWLSMTKGSEFESQMQKELHLSLIHISEPTRPY